MSFPSALTVLFVALKLLGYISWPWVWVISPLWIAGIIFLIVSLITGIIFYFSIK